MRPLLERDGLFWYLQLSEAPSTHTVDLGPTLSLDLDASGRVVGVEGRGCPKMSLSLTNALKTAGLAPTRLETT